MMPFTLCAGRRRHASSVNAIRRRLARNRHINEGSRVIVGWYMGWRPMNYCE